MSNPSSKTWAWPVTKKVAYQCGQVNDKGENGSWKAIGYYGPDPDFKAQAQKNKPRKGIVSVRPTPNSSGKEDQNVGEEELFGPLYKGIVNLKNPRQIVVEALQLSGFGVSTPHQKVSKLNSSLNPSLIIKCDAVVSVLEVLKRKKNK
ncbi:long-chain-alcohol oxidase [Sarracenia purpurea var. burkii]